MLFRVGDKYLNSAHVRQVHFKTIVLRGGIEDLGGNDYLGYMADKDVLFKGTISIFPVLTMTDDDCIELVDLQQELDVEEGIKFKHGTERPRNRAEHDRLLEAAKQMALAQSSEKLVNVKTSILNKLTTFIGIGYSSIYCKPV